MSQRSPLNERYQKFTKPKGQTRKSGGSAKPKRASANEAARPKAGGSALTRAARAASAKRSAKPKPKRSAPQRVPMTSEMRTYNRVYWVLMGVSLLAALGLLFLDWRGLAKNTKLVSFVWGVWAAGIGGGLYLQLGPIRRARRAALAQGKPGKKKDAAAGKDAAETTEGKDE